MPVYDSQQLTALFTAAELLRKGEPYLSVTEVARKIGMSKYHFIRQFRSLYGVTPIQYRNAERNYLVLRRLAEQLPVTDCCLEAGWNSLGTFSRRFSALNRMSPLQFRRIAKSENVFPGCISLMAQAFAISDKQRINDTL
ncbi:MAG: AraC family transcriptional regulator [Bryobacter sp.]